MSKLVCPHCDSHVSERASVCLGCGAEIVRGATRQERASYGCAFSLLGLVIAAVVMGTSKPPEPDSEGAIFVVLGLFALIAFAALVGSLVARLLKRSKLRFFRTYDHQ